MAPYKGDKTRGDMEFFSLPSNYLLKLHCLDWSLNHLFHLSNKPMPWYLNTSLHYLFVSCPSNMGTRQAVCPPFSFWLTPDTILSRGHLLTHSFASLCPFQVILSVFKVNLRKIYPNDLTR